MQDHEIDTESSLGVFAAAAAATGTGNRLVPKITISDNTSEVFCVRFSPDGKFLAAGTSHGRHYLYKTV